MANASNISVTGNYVKNIVTKFRSIHISQIPYFFPENVKSGRDSIKAACKFISGRNFIDMNMETEILTSVGLDPDQKQIDCIWMAIDLLSSEVSDTRSLDRLLNAVISIDNGPESVCFVSGGKSIIRAIAIENEYEVLNLLTTQTHICDIQDIPETDAAKSEYSMIIVIRDRNLLGHISSIGLKIPHKIALLEGGLLEKPTIKYLERASNI